MRPTAISHTRAKTWRPGSSIEMVSGLWFSSNSEMRGSWLYSISALCVSCQPSSVMC